MHPDRVRRTTSRYRVNQGFGQAFTINDKSPQAKGLVFWLPFTDIRGQAKHIDLVSGLVLTEGGTPVWVNDSERGWVMEFDDGSSEYLSVLSSPITDYPLTFSGWVRADALGINQYLISVGEAIGNNQHSLRIRDVNDIAYSVRGPEGVFGATTSTTVGATNIWHNLCAVGTNATNRAVYLDGGGKGTSVNNATPAGIDKLTIGCSYSVSGYFSGMITDTRIYNRALSDQEVYEIYKNPWDLFKVREPQVWVKGADVVSGGAGGRLISHKRTTSRRTIDQGFGQQFVLNDKSLQAKGLVFWLPFTDIRGQAKHIDLVSGLVLTEGGTPVWVNDSERGWVMEFDDGTPDYLSVTDTPVTGAPLSFSLWFNSDSDTNNQTLIAIGNSATPNENFEMEAGGAVADQIRLWTRTTAGGQAIASTSTTYTPNVWHQACGVFYAPDSRAVFLDGAGKGTNVQSRTPSGVNKVLIGSRTQLLNYMSGMITDARIYNRALSDQEVYELYKNPWNLFKVREPQVWSFAQAEDAGVGRGLSRYINIPGMRQWIAGKLGR